MIRIRSKKEGFRRCGAAHSEQWTEHPDERFTRAELKALQEDPMLQVEVLPGKKAKDEK